MTEEIEKLKAEVSALESEQAPLADAFNRFLALRLQRQEKARNLAILETQTRLAQEQAALAE